MDVWGEGGSIETKTLEQDLVGNKNTYRKKECNILLTK